MQQIAVEEQCVTRLQLAIHEIHCFQRVFDHDHIRTDLFPGKAMVDTAKLVGALDDLQAAVLLGRCTGPRARRINIEI